MYSDDECMVSSHSSASAERHIIAREQAQAGRSASEDGSDSSAPVLVESDDDAGDEKDLSCYHGAVEASTVPVECLERCAIFFDAALFDPKRPSGDVNERVVECSMRVVNYPFCRPTAAAPTQTLIHTPVVSATNMTKITRALTVERWGQLIKTQHGIPCTAGGTSTGFGELNGTVKDYKALIHSYCHTLRDAGQRGGGESGTSLAATSAHVSVALNEEELYEQVADIFWTTVNAAVQASREAHAPVAVAFLTTEPRREEVCRSLRWLQEQAQISLPPYQVFTVESALGEDWDALVMTEKENYSCGYHTHLMTNNYGNRRHCCEGTVTAMVKVMEAAVRNL